MATSSILVVEDNRDNLRLMDYLLRSRGYQPLSARNGAEGLDAAAREHPDLVLLDIQMPVMDGYAMAAAIRARDDLADTVLVAVTAFAMSGDQERVLAAGFDGCITKPIEPESFVDDVERFLPAGEAAGEGLP